MNKNKFGLLIVLTMLAIFTAVHQNCSEEGKGRINSHQSDSEADGDSYPGGDATTEDFGVPQDPQSGGNGQAYTGKPKKYIHWDSSGSCPGQPFSTISVLNSSYYLTHDNCKKIDSILISADRLKLAKDLSFIIYNAAVYLDTDYTRAIGQICGMVPTQRDRTSISGSSTKCFGHNPTVSCPEGFRSTWFSMRAWSADAISDTIYSCVRDRAQGPQGNNSQWCGAHFAGEGIQGSPVKCQGKIPGPNSCPQGMKSLNFSFIHYQTQASSASMWTCVQQDGFIPANTDPQGQWCGLEAKNFGNRNSGSTGLAIPCQDSPVGSCPTGFSRLTFQMVAWGDDDIADQISTCIRN